MRDASSFNEQDFISIFGQSPICASHGCNQNAIDVHHLMGRGYKYGIRPLALDRGMFSSIYNAAPLCRMCHSRGDLNNPSIQKQMLIETRGRVASSGYISKAKDEAFLEKFQHRYNGLNSGFKNTPLRPNYEA